MANHVITRVWIAEGNDATQEVMKKINERHQNDDAKKQWEHQVPTFALFEETLEAYDKEDYSSVTNMIGTKWSYVFDWDDCDSISFESAWGTPEGAIERIYKELEAVDEDVILAYTSEDEGPNWVEAGVYSDGELDDAITWDSDEFADLGIKLWWDEDAEGEEEPDDFEPNWEDLYELMDKAIDELVSDIHKYNRNSEDTLEEIVD